MDDVSRHDTVYDGTKLLDLRLNHDGMMKEQIGYCFIEETKPTFSNDHTLLLLSRPSHDQTRIP